MQAGTPPRAGWRKADLFAQPNASAPLPLFTQPNASAAELLAEQVPFDILEAYRDSLLISVAIDRLGRLRELTGAVLMRFVEHDDYDVIRLVVGQIDTRYPISIPTRGLPEATYAAGEYGVYLIQFHGPQKPEWLTAIGSAGAIPLRDVTANGYVVGATPQIADTLQQLPFIQWSTALHPYLKQVPEPADYPNGIAPVLVSFARLPGSDEAFQRVLQLLGPGYRLSDGSVTYISGVLTPDGIAAVLKEPSIIGIQYNGGGGNGGGSPAQIPTLSPVWLLALAILLVAIALRRTT